MAETGGTRKKLWERLKIILSVNVPIVRFLFARALSFGKSTKISEDTICLRIAENVICLKRKTVFKSLGIIRLLGVGTNVQTILKYPDIISTMR